MYSYKVSSTVSNQSLFAQPFLQCMLFQNSFTENREPDKGDSGRGEN